VVYLPTPLKNDGVKVSWDDDIPNSMERHKIHVPNHQPDKYSGKSQYGKIKFMFQTTNQICNMIFPALLIVLPHQRY